MIYYLFLLAAFFELGVSQKASPCPSVFSYEPLNTAEPDRWYGVLVLRNREQLKGIWIEVTLDEPAQLLGTVTLNCTELCKPSLTNWFGETSTTDYQEFTIRDMTYTLESDTPMSLRFFIKYDRRKTVPSVLAIRLNGKLICGERPQQEASTTRRPQSGIGLSEQSGSNRGTSSGSGSRGTSSTSTNSNTNTGGRGTSSSSNSGNRGTGTNSRPATTQSSRPSSNGGRVTSRPRPSSNTLTDSSGSSESNYNTNSNREPVYTSNSATTSNNNRRYNSIDYSDDSSQETFLSRTNTNNYAQRNSNSYNRDTTHRNPVTDYETASTISHTNRNQRNDNNIEINNSNRYYTNTERNQIQEPISVDGNTLHLSNESDSNFQTWNTNRNNNNNNRNSDSYNERPSNNRYDNTDNYDRSSSNRRNNDRSEDEGNDYNRSSYNNNNSNNRRRNDTVNNDLDTIINNDRNSNRNNNRQQNNNNNNYGNSDSNERSSDNWYSNTDNYDRSSSNRRNNSYWNSNRNTNNRQQNNNSYNTNNSEEDDDNDKILFTSDDNSNNRNRSNIGRNTNSERENNYSNNDDYDNRSNIGRNTNSERENNYSNNDDYDSSRQPGRNSNSRTSSQGRGTGFRNPGNYGTSSSETGNGYNNNNGYNNGRDPDYGSNSNNNNYNNNNRPSGSSSGSQNNNRNPSYSGSSSGGGLSFAEENNSDSDYFPGDFSVARPPAINRPSSPPRGNSGTNTIGARQPRCGTVGVHPRPLITHAQGTIPGEWPWHVALYHSQGIQLKYICGGTLVSEKHVVTAAHCVTKPSTTTTVGAENVLAYLGKYNLKKFGSEVQDREVSRIYIHPNYNSTYYFNDLAVLKLSEPVSMTNYVRASCLWEDETDLNSIVDQLGTVVGWGFDENKQISNELMKAEMPVVDTATCIYSNRDFFSQFTNEQTYCAGFRNGTSVCNGDSGGGMVFPKTHRDGSTTWQLRGVVSVGVALQGEPVCDSSHYIVFTDIAQHLDWIQEIMSQR